MERITFHIEVKRAIFVPMREVSMRRFQWTNVTMVRILKFEPLQYSKAANVFVKSIPFNCLLKTQRMIRFLICKTVEIHYSISNSFFFFNNRSKFFLIVSMETFIIFEIVEIKFDIFFSCFYDIGRTFWKFISHSISFLIR